MSLSPETKSAGKDEFASQEKSTTEDGFAAEEAPPSDGQDQVLIGGLNVNGLKRKSKMIKSLILSYQFDIFVITETKLTNKIAPKDMEDICKLKDYDYLRFDRFEAAPEDNKTGSDEDKGNNKPEDQKGNKDTETKRCAGGGILIYYRKDLGKATVRSEVRKDESYIQILHVSFSQSAALDLIAVYYPPNAYTLYKKKQDNDKRLDSVLDKDVFPNIRHTDRVVLVGDVNLNPLVAGCLEIINEIKAKGAMTQIIKVVTRVDVRHFKKKNPPIHRISHSLIDHIYVSEQLRNDILSSGVKRFGMSDHDLTYCNIRAPGFKSLRDHQEKSVAVCEMEDVKQCFIEGYRCCERLDALTYDGDEQHEIRNAWAIFKERNERVKKKRDSYLNENLSAACAAKIICHKESCLKFLKELHGANETCFCAPCSIR